MLTDSSERLDARRRQFSEQLPIRLDALYLQYRRIDLKNWQEVEARELYRLVNELADLASTFGLEQINDVSRSLASRLATLLNLAAPPLASQWEGLAVLLGQLMSLPQCYRKGRGLGEVSNICLVEKGQSCQQNKLEEILLVHDYQLHHCETLDNAASFMGGAEHPAAIVMVLSCLADGATAIAEFKASHKGAPPIIVCLPQDDLQTRLTAYRAGVTRLCQSPMEPYRLINLLDELTGRGLLHPYRVLLVDDDPLSLQAQAMMMRQAGIEVEPLSEPLSVLDAIERYQPDIMVLDADMAEASGFELAAILRKEERYNLLPILLLAAETDANKQYEILNGGADDYLPKPVVPEHLIAVVTAHAKRARLNREAMGRLEFSLNEREQEHQALNEHAIVSATDTTGHITYVNERFCQVSGYSREELIGQTHRIIKSDMHPSEFYQDLWMTIAKGGVWHGEVCNRRKDGSLYWVESTIKPFVDAKGNPYQYVSIRTDITKVKENERAMRAMVEGTAGAIGEAYFARAAEWLAKALGMRFGFIAEKDGREPSLIHTRAIWQGDHIGENSSYHLDNTPCENVEQNGLSIYSENVADKFPGYPWLRENNIESYIAIPLYDSGGKFLGLMGAMDDSFLSDSEAKVDLLRIFAARVAGEMERLRVEHASSIQEERLRRGQSYANMGTWDWDIHSGELFWTERIASLFGQPEGQRTLSYDKFLDTVHPDDRQAVREAATASIENDTPYDIEHRVVWPDGSVHWVLERGAVVRDKHGSAQHMLGVVMDIHERKMAEKARQESEEKFRKLFEVSPIGIALNDMDGSFIEANQALLDSLGYTLEEFCTLTYWQLTPEAYAEQEHRHLEELLKRGRYGPYEKEYIHKDGHLVPVLLNGTLVEDHLGNKRIWSIVQDITKRKKAEQELMIFKRIFDATDQGIGVTDAQGHLLYSNNAHDRIHGYEHENVLGKHFSEFFSADTLSWAVAAIMDSIRQGNSWAGLLPVLRPDGKELMTSANVGFIAGPDGTPQYMFNLMSDYTPEIRRQKQFAEAKEEAERANQAKSEFLSSMSHELRTPMNAILGFAQILEFDQRLDTEQQDSVHEIIKAGQHLLELINEVLDLAKIEAGRIDLSLEPVAAAELIEECLALVQPLAVTRSITLESDINTNVVLRADRVRLKQILLNLLSNAIKYNRIGGQVRINAEGIGREQIRLSVIDTGEGISEDKLEKLFQPFNRLDKEFSEVEGTGIGLTISRRLVELMGGNIGVKSSPGVGSCFWIELPNEVSNIGSQSIKNLPIDKKVETGQSRQTVLYIEDNPSNLKLVSQLLSREAHIKLLTAHSSELGIELAKAHRPKLILLDINMPGMGGWEVLQVLKSIRELKNVPVIAITANAMASDIERGKAAGFSAYLTKPIDAHIFLTTVEHWLGKQIS